MARPATAMIRHDFPSHPAPTLVDRGRASTAAGATPSHWGGSRRLVEASGSRMQVGQGPASTPQGIMAAGTMMDHGDLASPMQDAMGPSTGADHDNGHRSGTGLDHGLPMHDSRATQGHHPPTGGADGAGTALHHGASSSPMMPPGDPASLPHAFLLPGGHGPGGEPEDRLAVALGPDLDADLDPRLNSSANEGVRAGQEVRGSTFRIADSPGIFDPGPGGGVDITLEEGAASPAPRDSRGRDRTDPQGSPLLPDVETISLGPMVAGCIIVALVASRASLEGPARSSRGVPSGPAGRRWVRQPGVAHPIPNPRPAAARKLGGS